LLHQGEQPKPHDPAKSQGQVAGALAPIIPLIPPPMTISWALATLAVEIAKSKATAAHKQSIF